MKKYLGKWLFSAGSLLLIVLLISCQSGEEENLTAETEQAGIEPIVTVVMDDNEEIKIELYPDIAPNTVNNFISLVEEDFYKGLIFHRVIPGFMIQGGDPDGMGTGGPGYGIKGEFGSNGFENNLTHERGVVSMARSQSPDSAGSQFFIITDDSSHLDGDYAAFGKVVEGMEVVDAIVGVETDPTDKPLKNQTIHSASVDLLDYEPSEVNKE